MGVVIDITHMVARIENPQNRIREWRNRRGMTLVELGEKIGTKNGVLSRLERGDRSLDLSWLRRIARALEVAPADLLNAEDNPLSVLNEEQRYVVETMLDVGGGATRTLHRVSEGLRDFHHQAADAKPAKHA